MRPWVTFRDLAVGEAFRFLYGLHRDRPSDEVYVKVSPRRYRPLRGTVRWMTGALSAVRVEAV